MITSHEKSEMMERFRERRKLENRERFLKKIKFTTVFAVVYLLSIVLLSVLLFFLPFEVSRLIYFLLGVVHGYFGLIMYRKLMPKFH